MLHWIGLELLHNYYMKPHVSTTKSKNFIIFETFRSLHGYFETMFTITMSRLKMLCLGVVKVHEYSKISIKNWLR